MLYTFVPLTKNIIKESRESPKVKIITPRPAVIKKPRKRFPTLITFFVYKKDCSKKN